MKRFLVGNNVWCFSECFSSRSILQNMFVTIVKDADDESCQTLCKTLHKTKDQHTQMNKYHIKFHQWSRQCLDNRSLELNNVMTPHYDATFDSVVQKRSLFDEEDHLATRQQVVNDTDQLPSSFINLNVILLSFAPPPYPYPYSMRVVHDPHWPCPTAKTENHPSIYG